MPIYRSPARAVDFKLHVLFSVIVILCLIPGLALAEKWLLTEKKDQEIRKILETTLPIAEAQIERFDADVAQVFNQLVIVAAEDSYQEFQNSVWWVCRGEPEHITNYVRDFDPGVKLHKVMAFLIRPGRFDRQAALQAEIIPLEKDRIRIQEGDGKNRATNLVIGFDTAQPGDLLGISIQLKIQESLNWRQWLVAEHEPVARAELRVKNDWRIVFNVAGNRFEKGTIQKEIIEENDGIVRDLRLWVEGVNPIVDEPYSAPGYIQSPGFLVARRARRIEVDNGVWVWWYQRHWNQVASRMAASESWYLEKSEKVAEQTEQLVTGLSTPETLEALGNFVHEELLSLDSSYFFRSDEAPTVDKIWEARAGSDIEKAYLLLAMLRSRGVAADIIWTHDPNRGGFFQQYPNWGQVPVPLVRVTVGEKTHWYDLGCPECPPGTVRPRFIAAPALFYRSDSASRNDDFIDNVMNEAWARRLNPSDLYLSTIDQEEWCELIKIPGDPNSGVGWIEEKIRFEKASGTASIALLRLRSAGLTSLKREAVRSGDSEPVAQEWALDRLEAAQEDSILTASPSRADTLDVLLRLECLPIAKPMGDTWILPAEVVWGEPTIGPWPADRVSSFTVMHNNERHWEFRIPLPEGWEGAEIPEDRTLGFKLMQYRVTFRILEGELVVRRIFVERTGIVEDLGSIALIGEEASAIREIETSDVVLHRKGF